MISLQKCQYELNNSRVAIYMDNLVVIIFRQMAYFRHNSEYNSFAVCIFLSNKNPKGVGQSNGGLPRAPQALSPSQRKLDFRYLYSHGLVAEKKGRRVSSFYSFIFFNKHVLSQALCGPSDQCELALLSGSFQSNGHTLKCQLSFKTILTKTSTV